MRKISRFLLPVPILLLLVFCQSAEAALAETRVALVIGNGDYEHVDKLANPVTDSRAMRNVLAKLGFETVYGENLDKRSLERTIGRFARATEGADVAFVYFAGHGATFGDIPYVVPIDAQFSTLEDMPYELVPVETLIGELRRAKGVRIAVLDACRDNSAEHELKRANARGGEITRGLAPVKNPEGLIIAYATQYLSTAADGDPNGNSPFTGALVDAIATPGLDVKDVFYRTAREVIAKTNGRQRPELSISFYDSYSLTSSGLDHATASQTSLGGEVPISPPASKGPEPTQQARLPNEGNEEPAIARPNSASESCARRSTSDGGILYCASSVLTPQFGNSYGVANLFGAASAAWVAASHGYAIGEWIIVEFDEKRTVTGISIRNGYQKNNDIFFLELSRQAVRCICIFRGKKKA
jgi:hypothetical protein